MAKVLLAAAILSALSVGGAAQNGTGAITGRVRTHDGEYLAGMRVAATEGQAEAMIDPTSARALIERYRAAGFFGACSGGGGGLSGPTSTVAVSIGGQEKGLVNNPGGLWGQLENDLERMADTHRWIHGNPEREQLFAFDLMSDAFGAKPGVTPLMRASAAGYDSDLTALLAAKADPNARDVSGMTALMYAAVTGDPRVSRALLEAGADPNARTLMGQTAIMAHVFAIPERPGQTGRIASLRLLIDAGADINALDRNGQTALTLAIPRSLRYALFPAQPLALIRDTPSGAPFLPLPSLVAFLRDAGARSDIRDAAGRTALDVLNAENARRQNPSRSNYEELRLILEQPAGPIKKDQTVRVRGTASSPLPEFESITLHRAGEGWPELKAAVGRDGTVEFPAVPPGVYMAAPTPTPFPLAAVPVVIPANVTEANITVPVLRRIRVRSTVQGGGEAPDFRLQFFKLEGNGVRIPLIVQPLSRPANAVAAAKAWAPYGGPFVELPASADGSWEIILPEGLYTIEAVFPLPGSLSWPFGEVPSPRTTYIPTITAAGADITSQSLRIAGDTEIVVSLAPTIIR